MASVSNTEQDSNGSDHYEEEFSPTPLQSPPQESEQGSEGYECEFSPSPMEPEQLLPHESSDDDVDAEATVQDSRDDCNGRDDDCVGGVTGQNFQWANQLPPVSPSQSSSKASFDDESGDD